MLAYFACYSLEDTETRVIQLSDYLSWLTWQTSGIYYKENKCYSVSM